MTEDERQVVVYEILKIRVRLLDYWASYPLHDRKHLIVTDEQSLDHYPMDAILEGVHCNMSIISCLSREDAFAFMVMYGGEYIFMDDYIRCNT